MPLHPYQVRAFKKRHDTGARDEGAHSLILCAVLLFLTVVVQNEKTVLTK